MLIYRISRVYMKQKHESRLHFTLSRALKVFLGLVFILVLASISRGVLRMVASQNRVGEAEVHLAELKADQEKLKSELEAIQSGFNKERLARDKLGLAKEGEIVIVLPEEGVLRRLSPRRLTEEKTESLSPNWKKWWELLVE